MKMTNETMLCPKRQECPCVEQITTGVTGKRVCKSPMGVITKWGLSCRKTWAPHQNFRNSDSAEMAGLQCTPTCVLDILQTFLQFRAIPSCCRLNTFGHVSLLTSVERSFNLWWRTRLCGQFSQWLRIPVKEPSTLFSNQVHRYSACSARPTSCILPISTAQNFCITVTLVMT